MPGVPGLQSSPTGGNGAYTTVLQQFWSRDARPKWLTLMAWLTICRKGPAYAAIVEAGATGTTTLRIIRPGLAVAYFPACMADRRVSISTAAGRTPAVDYDVVRAASCTDRRSLAALAASEFGGVLLDLSKSFRTAVARAIFAATSRGNYE